MVTALVKGADKPATAAYTVQNLEFTRLEVIPYRFDLTVGQRLWYEIYAVGPAGRRKLGDDPELKITHHRLNGQVDTLGYPHMVEGKWPTNEKTETVKIRWKALQLDVAFTVRDERITGLVIRPDDVGLEEGETVDFQVFVRRGGRLDPLSNLDGVELSVNNPVIASQTAALRVRGESEGTTAVVAQYAGQRARARVQVRPRQTPIAPPGKPIALRLLPDTFQIQIGTSGSTIRVVRIYSDGRKEEVAHLAEITANPAGIVEIISTPSGPLLRPKVLGQTQVHAKVGNLETETPMLVDVTNDPPRRPRVVVNPQTVRTRVGDPAVSLTRVVVIPGEGGPAIELPYKITATKNDVFEVENGRNIQGKKKGRAIANVVIDNPDGKYNGESATVVVVVSDPNLPGGKTPSGEGQSEEIQYKVELRGPLSTNEGAEVAFRVDWVEGSSGQEVTGNSTLVLADGDEKFAQLQPGCKLIALKPGIVNVRARYNGEFSNMIPLRIDPLAKQFQKLDLEMQTNPLGIGETRGYQVWGTPAGGGTRQDLTRLITTDPSDFKKPHVLFKVLKPTANADVAAHVTHPTPNIVGRNPGTISLHAAIGNTLLSKSKEVSIIDEIRKPADLRVEPASITVRVGETTPPLKVLVRISGDVRYRELAADQADYSSSNADVLSPLDETDVTKKGRFLAKKTGNTRIQVSYQGQQAWVNVAVVADRFKTVVLGKPDFGQSTFRVPVEVKTDRAAGNLEYRVFRMGEILKPEQGWKEATVQGDTQFVKLIGPNFNPVNNTLFRMVIEARDKRTNTIDRYPSTFSIDVNRK